MSKYYKVIGADNKSCHGGDFDWTAYLPKGKKPGKWTPRIENVVACKKGYHVTRYWNMWYEEGCRIFECEVDGVVVAVGESVAGFVDKVVCTRIRLCKEIIPQFDSNRNTGNRNTGNYNTGNYNTCNRSSGFFNTVNDTINVFNKPCKIDVWRRACMPDFIYFDIVGTYKESWRKAYDGASEADKFLLVKLPNFDADVFYEISGIMVDPKTGKEVI